MQAGHVTPVTSTARELAALQARVDLLVDALAAKTREALLKDREIAQLRRDQTTLILYSRRDA